MKLHEFLEQFKDMNPEADIFSLENSDFKIRVIPEYVRNSETQNLELTTIWIS